MRKNKIRYKIKVQQNFKNKNREMMSARWQARRSQCLSRPQKLQKEQINYKLTNKALEGCVPQQRSSRNPEELKN